MPPVGKYPALRLEHGMYGHQFTFFRCAPGPRVLCPPRSRCPTRVPFCSNDAPGDADTSRLLAALLAEPGFGTACMKDAAGG